MAPSATSSIPLRSAMGFFCRAASHDSSAKVRSFCREASVTVSNLFHPRAPNLNSRLVEKGCSISYPCAGIERRAAVVADRALPTREPSQLLTAIVAVISMGSARKFLTKEWVSRWRPNLQRWRKTGIKRPLLLSLSPTKTRWLWAKMILTQMLQMTHVKNMMS